MQPNKNLLQIIKQIAMEAVTASKPADFLYGTVTSVSPLKIKIDQKLTLTSAFLVLTSAVKDADVEMIIGGTKQKVTIKNGLNKGEHVILLRKQGGQRYLVLDRVGD